MKVGMVFECGPQGADVKVCRLLAKRLRADIEISPVTLGNKPQLIQDCGNAAAQLLREGCERVVIVWDLYPPWREKKARPCRKEDRERILASLQDAGVASSNIYLVCIREELEAWLLADRRALEAVLSRPAHPVRVRGIRNPERERNPKGTLQRIFEEHGKPYRDYVHAEIIVQHMPDLNHIAGCETFRRFALKVADITLP